MSEQENEAVRDLALKTIRHQNERVKERLLIWTRAKNEAAAAKKDYDESVAELSALIDNQTETLPLFEAEEPKSEDA